MNGTTCNPCYCCDGAGAHESGECLTCGGQGTLVPSSTPTSADMAGVACLLTAAEMIAADRRLAAAQDAQAATP